MKKPDPDQDHLPSRLKHLIANLFRLDLIEPDQISDDEPLIGGGLGLDSFDALELAICIEEECGFTIHGSTDSHRAFASITSLVGFIRAQAKSGRGHQPGPAIAVNIHPMLMTFSPGLTR